MNSEPICYQCGKPAIYTEDYDGIPIGTCEDGHRTGKLLEDKQADWTSWFKKAV